MVSILRIHAPFSLLHFSNLNCKFLGSVLRSSLNSVTAALRDMLVYEQHIRQYTWLPDTNNSYVWVLHLEGAWGSGVISPRIINLATRKRWNIGFVSTSLYLRDKIVLCSQARSVGRSVR